VVSNPSCDDNNDVVLLFSPRWYPTFAVGDVLRASKKAAARFRAGDLSYPHDLAIKRPMGFSVPYYSLAIAAYLKKGGFDPRIIDLQVEISPRHRIEQHRDKILCVAIECERPFSFAEGSALAESLRTVLPGVPIVWFGIIASIIAEYLCKSGLADAVVRGIPEITFLETVRSYAENKSVSDVESVTCLNPDGELIENPYRPLAFEEDSPPLDYSLIPVENYALGAGKHVVLRTSVGCASRCAFCWFPTIYGTDNKGHSAERVIEEMARLQAEYGLERLRFADQSFFLKKVRVEKICQGLIDGGVKIKWEASGQVDIFSRFSDDLLQLIARSGCSGIQVGIETGSPALLKLLGKPLTGDKVITLAERLYAVGIKLIANFIFGLPGETEDDFQKSWDLIRRLQKIHPGMKIDYYFYTPYPGNALYDTLVAEGKLDREGPTDPKTYFEFTRCMEKPWFEKSYGRRVSLFYHVMAIDDFRVRHVSRKFLKLFIGAYRAYARWRVKRRFFSLAIDYHLIKLCYMTRLRFRWRRAFGADLCE